MVSPTATAVAYLATLVSVAVCDYQVEVNLISYNNSARRLENGQCCDIKTSNAQAECSLQDTCDVQFTFTIENLNTVTTFSDQNKVVGRYGDVIRFDNCSTFLNGVRNPLTFIIPASQWKSGEIIRILAEIVDTDQIGRGIPSSLYEIIMSLRPILLIQRPPAPFSEYILSSPFYGPNSLSLMYEHRVICSAGTCGSDCSQSTNCLPFPSCVPITCADSLCLNGGTCTLVQGSSFSCICREGFTGPACGTIVSSVSTSTMDNLSITTATAPVMITSSTSQDIQAEKCNGQTCPVTAAVVSSIAIFFFTSLIFLTIGILIGYFVQKHKFTANVKSSSTPDRPAHNTPPHVSYQPTFPAPEYAPIHAKGTLVEEHVQGFGMKKCEAYALSSTATPGGQSTASRPEEHTYSPVQVNSNNYVPFHK